jgi:hypothetical protein
VGQQLVFDQVFLDLPVQYPEGIERPVCSFIVDRQTLLVLGAGLAQQNEVGAGFIRSIGDLERERILSSGDIVGSRSRNRSSPSTGSLILEWTSASML